MKTDGYGPEASAPPAFGAIAELEKLIGAPLSEDAKKALETMALRHVEFGANLAFGAILAGVNVATRSAEHGSHIASKCVDIAANLTNSKTVEGAYLEPAAA